MAGDIIAITVNSLDQRAAAPYNLVRPDTPAGILPITDFLVDSEGDIMYPGLGKMKIGGLTFIELEQRLVEKLKPFLNDPVVNIRIVNFDVTVMGEVTRPATYRIENERATIVEALGMAGDVTDFGDREDILVIREVDGERQFRKINLLDKSVFQSEFFYLRQNDVIYVAPTKGKAFSARSEPFSRVVLPVVGVLTSLASLIIIASR